MKSDKNAINNSEQKQTDQILFWILFFAFLVSLIPVLLSSKYCTPWADDYVYGFITHKALKESGSFWQTIRAATGQAKSSYYAWQGTYSAIFLMTIQPAVFGERFYALVPWIMILSMMFGTGWFIIIVCVEVFRFKWEVGGIIALVLGFLCVQLVHSPVNSFFWFNGSVFYTFFYFISLVAYGTGIRLVRRGGIGRSLLLCFLAAFLAGGNYVTALNIAIVSVASVCLLFLTKKKTWRRLVAPTAVFMICFVVSMAAPGNTVRQESMGETQNAMMAILHSFYWAAHDAVQWFSLPLLAAILFLIPIVWREASNSCFRYPGLVTLISYCLFSAQYTPTLYASNGSGAERMMNIIFFFYLFLCILNIVYWTGWAAGRTRKSKKRDTIQISAPKMLLCYSACTVLCLVYILQGNPLTSVSILGSLRDGEPQQYHDAYLERLDLFLDESVKDVTIEPYPVLPWFLTMGDLHGNADSWINRSVAAYYDKDSIIVTGGILAGSESAEPCV